MDTIDLNGKSGDDTFVVRSFVRVIRDGVLTPPDVGQLNLKVCPMAVGGTLLLVRNDCWSSHILVLVFLGVVGWRG